MTAWGILQDGRLRVGALVGCCFLLGSTGWLAWLYRITELADPASVDFYTMVLGYLAQAAGVGAYMPVRAKASRRAARNAAMVAIGLYPFLLEYAVMADGLGLVLAGVVVVVVSLVKNAGFSFPTADLSGAVNLELSRLFYGLGLIVAGVVADRDRRYVFVCCAASLVMPFLMSALSGAQASSVALWATGYLLFGFFSVFRVVLFADLGERTGRAWLACAGLALGRVGDVAGTALCLALDGESFALVMVAAVLFVLTAALLFALYDRLFGADAAAGEGEERDPLAAFGERYDLSARECDVMRLVVGGMTNARAASELSVSEATVKYHMRNILHKTACANRVELKKLYESTSVVR